MKPIPETTDNRDPHVRLLVTLAAWGLTVGGAAIGLAMWLDPKESQLQVILHFSLAVLGAGLLALVHYERDRLAQQLLIAGFISMVTVIAFFHGGAHGPNLINYPVAIIICAWALGSRTTVKLAVTLWLCCMGLIWANTMGWVQEVGYENWIVSVVFYTLIIVITTAVTLVSRARYQEQVKEARMLAAHLVESESSLRNYQEELEELVAARTAELAAARAEAERLLRVKSEFLANMSHEIRTPLNGLLGLAQIGLRKQADPAVRADFQRMLETGRLLQGVIDDILDFSKIEAGKLHIEQIPYALRHTCEHALSLLAERAERKGLDLRLRIADNCPAACLGDPLRIAQILMNLLSNAVKFTDAGTVTLAVERADDTLILSVEDSGIGMTEEQLARVFIAFEQADGSTTRQFGGTGLGLTITRRLAELMGGSISASSQAGAGSCFTVRLPCRPAELPTEAVAEVHHSSLHGLRVLVVDDEQLNRIILEEILSEEGILVAQASNGQAALDYLEAHGPSQVDVVLMDVQMPVMNGYTASRILRERYPDLPVVGQTANVMEDDHQQCLDAGMREVIAKPIDMPALLACLLRQAQSRVK